ncbi:MAG: biotin/lipoyl-containing protein [Candidatus Zixiibacteriota bacterium]
MKEMKLELNGKEYSVTIEEFGVSKAIIVVDDSRYEVNLKDLGIEEAVESANINIGGAMPTSSAMPAATAASTAFVPSNEPEEIQASSAASGSENAILAPLPGLIMKITVNVGDQIKAGQNVAVMEAMKMENHVPSTANGKVKKILVNEGDSVAEGAPLIELE